MLAICTVRTDAHYRREVFCAGLKRAGYTLADFGTPSSKRDLLIIWNRYGLNESRADNWEASGGTVLVAENGYIGKDSTGWQYYALAIHGHNGSGWWPTFTDNRFDLLGIELQPWITRDGVDLVCGQRGIGSRTMKSPPNWDRNVVPRIPQPSKFRIRPHPGNLPAPTTVEQDLEAARRCIIWSSSSGVKALAMGIPVRYDAPHWICSVAATRVGETADRTDNERRAYAMRRAASAQFSSAELESGFPFVVYRDACEVAKW